MTKPRLRRRRKEVIIWAMIILLFLLGLWAILIAFGPAIFDPGAWILLPVV